MVTEYTKHLLWKAIRCHPLYDEYVLMQIDIEILQESIHNR